MFNQAIAARNAKADTIPFTVESRLEWFNSHSTVGYPLHVCETDDGQVRVWFSQSAYRGRAALARTVEISYYVDYAQYGKGIGSALLRYALDDCARIWKQVLLAIVLDWNVPRFKLLE